MRIGELAGATGATVRALRHYEQARLISSRRAPNGYRVYAASAVVRVRNIRFLLTAGLTLDDVRVFLPCLDGDMTAGPPSPRALAVAADRLAVLDERIAARTAVRDRLAAALREANAATGAAREANAATAAPREPNAATAAPREPNAATAAPREAAVRTAAPRDAAGGGADGGDTGPADGGDCGGDDDGDGGARRAPSGTSTPLRHNRNGR